MANPYSVEVPNVLQSLMAGEQSYKSARDSRMQDQVMSARQEAAKGIASGGDTRSILAQLAVYDPQGAHTLAGLGQNERDFQFRQQESARSQGNADRTFTESQRQFNLGADGGRMPFGWSKGPNGQPVPTAGGPADPKYIAAATEAKDKGRPMSITDITKLSEEGGKFADLNRFGDTFKPEFAGYTSTAVGNAANIAGRHLPESIVGKTMAEGSAWWQGYDKYKNVVRHELYGAALTKPETQAFERADITPGMTPDQIKTNLALQKTIVENGLKRKASAMISAGYDPKAIGAAYGIDLAGIGVTATGRKGGAAPPSQSGTAQAASNVPPEAIEFLKKNPGTRKAFDIKFGQGASAQALGQ